MSHISDLYQYSFKLSANVDSFTVTSTVKLFKIRLENRDYSYDIQSCRTSIGYFKKLVCQISVTCTNICRSYLQT